ncbi:YidH family protein [Gephyromycinifex aptenodytis]|uniref:YidH family protein n=1 Tax=Gephyromycinifex aptenodytis TaxID=2716227 RepID=UPI0014454123|nr:DUF202 domain-containing protein [Gephyromycinifex aptenodytis]
MSTAARKWPARVYRDGNEPDPRFSLANERTFLAWIRTSLALLVAAAALDVVPLSLPEVVQQIAAVGLALSGAAAAAQAWFGWARTERALRHGGPLPSNPMTLPLVAVLMAIAVVLLLAALGVGG